VWVAKRHIHGWLLAKPYIIYIYANSDGARKYEKWGHYYIHNIENINIHHTKVKNSQKNVIEVFDASATEGQHTELKRNNTGAQYLLLVEYGF